MTEAERAVNDFRMGLMSINHILRMCRIPFDRTDEIQLVLELDTPIFHDLHMLLVHNIRPWTFTDMKDVMDLTVARDEFTFDGVKIRRRR